MKGAILFFVAALAIGALSVHSLLRGGALEFTVFLTVTGILAEQGVRRVRRRRLHSRAGG